MSFFILWTMETDLTGETSLFFFFFDGERFYSFFSFAIEQVIKNVLKIIETINKVYVPQYFCLYFYNLVR